MEFDRQFEYCVNDRPNILAFLVGRYNDNRFVNGADFTVFNKSIKTIISYNRFRVELRFFRRTVLAYTASTSLNCRATLCCTSKGTGVYSAKACEKLARPCESE